MCWAPLSTQPTSGTLIPDAGAAEGPPGHEFHLRGPLNWRLYPSRTNCPDHRFLNYWNLAPSLPPSLLLSRRRALLNLRHDSFRPASAAQSSRRSKSNGNCLLSFSLTAFLLVFYMHGAWCMMPNNISAHSLEWTANKIKTLFLIFLREKIKTLGRHICRILSLLTSQLEKLDMVLQPHMVEGCNQLQPLHRYHITTCTVVTLIPTKYQASSYIWLTRFYVQSPT